MMKYKFKMEIIKDAGQRLWGWNLKQILTCELETEQWQK